MERNRRVALVVPHLENSLDNDLVGGVFSYGALSGFDTVVLTGINSSRINNYSHSYSKSMNNIYTLLKDGDFDGIIFAAGRFSSDSTRDKIFRMIRERDIPCVVIDYKCDDMQCVYSPQREYMKLMTRHLINVHNCRTLYCITGMPDDDVSAERLAGFIDALDEAGIDYDDNSVQYGYFCREIPRQIGIDIADGVLPVPDGIVCADDVMAAGICAAFRENNISVPEDVAVVGYKGSAESCVHDPFLTTGTGHDWSIGAEAMKKMLELLGCDELRPVESIDHIYIGSSCGCHGGRPMMCRGNSERNDLRYVRGLPDKHNDRQKLVIGDIQRSFGKSDNIEKLAEKSNRLGYMLLNWDSVSICLCEDWMFDFDNRDSFRREGFSENMTYHITRNNKMSGGAKNFDIKDVVPPVSQTDCPHIYLVTSLFYQKQIFGYVCTSYTSAEDIDIGVYYRCWKDALCSQLHIMEEKLFRVHVSSRVENLSVIDPLTGMYNKRGLMEKFPSFIASAGGDRLAMFILAYSEQQSGTSDVSPLSIVTNVLCDYEKESIISVPEENIIVCIRRANRETDTETASKHFIESIRILVKNFYNGGAKIKIDKLALVCRFFDEKDNESFGAALDEMIDMAKVKALTVDGQSEDCREHLHRIRNKFLENPQQDWTIDSISKEIGISKSHLQRLYKEEFGSSCIDDIISARLDRAKWLLVNTDLKIGRIAEQCGYLNESHFMRQFKTKIGVTALKFRKDHQNTVLAEMH